MSNRSKRMKSADQLHVRSTVYKLDEAIDLLKKAPSVKFDQTVDISLKIGVDPKKSDQMVRGTVTLPHGTGQKVTIVVIAKGDKTKEALDAGADFAGGDELLEKIKGGWTDFTGLIATPDMMRELGKLGKILGPRGLMPTPKAGTVTNDVTKAVNELKAGKIEFKVDKTGVINSAVGKLSFEEKNLSANVVALMQAIFRSKPSSSKGAYFRSLYLTSTMGPGLRIDLQSIAIA